MALPATIRPARGGAMIGVGGGVLEVEPDLGRALEEGESETARATAHKLAGGFALYGFLWASGRSRMIELRASPLAASRDTTDPLVSPYGGRAHRGKRPVA